MTEETTNRAFALIGYKGDSFDAGYLSNSRYYIARIIEEWCEDKGFPVDAHNVLDAMADLGIFAAWHNELVKTQEALLGQRSSREVEYVVDPKTPKLKRDWIGRHVRLKREVRNNGGVIFGAGTVMRATQYWRGLTLVQTSICPHCGCGADRTISRVSLGDVELLKPAEGGE